MKKLLSVVPPVKARRVDLNDVKIPPFWKRGEGGIFSERLGQKSPPPPFHKGGPKVTAGEFLQHDLESFLLNKSGAAQAFMGNIFAPVESSLRPGSRIFFEGLNPAGGGTGFQLSPE